MPYIKKQEREKFAKVLQEFSELQKNTNLSSGDMNYLLTSILLEFSKKNQVNYAKYNEIIGVLECCKLEFYRKIITPYEKQKISENGSLE